MNDKREGFNKHALSIDLRRMADNVEREIDQKDALIAALMLNCDRIDEHGFNCQTGNEHCTLELYPLVEDES